MSSAHDELPRIISSQKVFSGKVFNVTVDTVREGEMMREVRGPGVLVPKDIRWVTAQSAGRIAI